MSRFLLTTCKPGQLVPSEYRRLRPPSYPNRRRRCIAPIVTRILRRASCYGNLRAFFQPTNSAPPSHLWAIFCPSASMNFIDFTFPPLSSVNKVHILIILVTWKINAWFIQYQSIFPCSVRKGRVWVGVCVFVRTLLFWFNRSIPNVDYKKCHAA